MTYSQFLLYFSWCFILGVFLSSFLNQIGALIPYFFILGSVMAISFLFFKKNKRKKIIKICLVGFFLIVLSFGFFWHFASDNQKNFSVFSSNEKVIISGIIVEEPDLRDKTTHLVLKVSEIQNKKVSNNFEKILIITEKYFKADYYDKIKVKGKIQKPEFFNGFDYPGYLAKDGIYSILFYPEIEIIGKKDSRLSIKAKALEFKNKARKIVYQNFPSPHFYILSAMTLGDKREIPQNWQEKLSVSGVRHITAVSGLHVTVLTVILIGFFSNLGISRKESFVFIVLVMLFFIFITGMQPSAIRAGVMGGCFLFSKILGRMGNSFRLLFFTAFLMLLFNPLLLKNDIGFQLSFLAVLGIILFFSFFDNIFYFFPENIRRIMATSFSAHVFVFPVIGYYFGEVSIVFPITNILIIPIIYWIMIFGLGFIVFYFVLELLSAVFLVPLWLLLNYLVFVVGFFSKLSWASIPFNDNIFTLSLFYITFFFWIATQRNKNKDNTETSN